jgi:hypothetical protein
MMRQLNVIRSVKGPLTVGLEAGLFRTRVPEMARRVLWKTLDAENLAPPPTVMRRRPFCKISLASTIQI